jgi:hypothetical protein
VRQSLITVRAPKITETRSQYEAPSEGGVSDSGARFAIGAVRRARARRDDARRRPHADLYRRASPVPALVLGAGSAAIA